jgi:hypothetical protein
MVLRIVNGADTYHDYATPGLPIRKLAGPLPPACARGRDDEAWIGKLPPHCVADGQFLLNARLAGMRREHHDLLDRFMAQHGVDFVPSIGAAAQAPAVDPHAVPRHCQFRGKPEREFIIVRRRMRDEHSGAGERRGCRCHAGLAVAVKRASDWGAGPVIKCGM